MLFAAGRGRSILNSSGCGPGEAETKFTRSRDRRHHGVLCVTKTIFVSFFPADLLEVAKAARRQRGAGGARKGLVHQESPRLGARDRASATVASGRRESSCTEEWWNFYRAQQGAG